MTIHENASPDIGIETNDVSPAMRMAHEIVAATISPDTSGAEVSEFIDKSNALGLLFHGIRIHDKIEAVKHHGVEPLLGGESYWTGGTSLLYATPPTPTMSTLRWASATTFFDYAWSKDATGNPLMTMAVTNLPDLAEAGIQPNHYAPAGETRINQLVDPSLLTFVTAQAQTPEETRVSMFKTLLDGARSGTITAA